MGKSITFAVTNDIRPDRRMIRICNTLQAADYDVTLIGRKQTRSLPLPDYAFKTHRISCIFNKGPLFYAEYNWRLRKHLVKTKPDIIGAVDYDTLKGTSEAAKKLGCKMVFDAHELFEEVPELEGRNQVKGQWLRIAKKAMPQTNVRYAVSNRVALALEKTFKQSFKVIHNYPVLTPGEPSALRDDIIVYLGVLNKGRGLEQMIKAMHQIKAKLWIIGEGDLQETLWKLADQEGLMSKVVFKGFVPPEELPPLLQKARIGINLLDKKSKSYQFSLANKFFDYIHAGLPQVCMDFPEYRHYNDQHRVATLINDLNVHAVAYAINHLLEDRNYWFTYHTTCLEARRYWCWQNEEPKLKALIAGI